MTSQVPLFVSDFVIYLNNNDKAEHGEILELDIPHPGGLLSGSFIRLDSLWGTKILTRRQIKGVLCPQCQPGGKFEITGEYGSFILLELVTGGVTDEQTHVKETRWFRYCPECHYFKEATA